MAEVSKFFSEVFKGAMSVILEDRKGKHNEFEWKLADVLVRGVTDNFIYTEADKAKDAKKLEELKSKEGEKDKSGTQQNAQDAKPQNTGTKDNTQTTSNTQGASSSTTNIKSAQNVSNATNVTNAIAASNDNYVSNLLNSYFGAHNGNSANSNTKLSAVIIVNNYFENSTNNSSVAVIIDNVANFQHAQNYIDAIMKVQSSGQIQQNVKKEDNSAGATKAEQKSSAVQNSQIAPDVVKDFFASNANNLPTTIIIISFDNKCAEVLSNDKDQKNELVAEVANIKGVEKLQEKDKTYEIVKGDTLWQIARDNNITLAELKEANPWTEDRFSSDGKYALIYPGEQLIIPGTLEAELSKELNMSSKDLNDLSKNSSKEIEKMSKEVEKETEQNVNQMTCNK